MQVFRVLVADDHPLFRTALADLLAREQDFQLIGAVEGLDQAREVLAERECDLVILDLLMPGMDEPGAVAGVRELRPNARVAVISGNLDTAAVAAGLQAGATGFLPKSFDPPVILAALRLILTGAIYVPHGLMPGVLPPSTGTGAGTGSTPPPASGAPLSQREQEILTLMAQGASHKEVARALNVAEVTVKLYAQRIVRKLGAKNRTAAIAKAIQSGIIDLGT
jgi:DNA-binding NarL/FixJ family response regulator